MYLLELRNALLAARGIDIDESTISRTLHRQGFTRKKVVHLDCTKFLLAHVSLIIQVSRSAIERNDELRAQYQLIVGERFTPEMLVFLDESACNRHTVNRPYAWAPSSDRARRRDFFVRGQR
jgi:hypothetical protein